MQKHISFPSIGQFRDTVKLVRQNAKWVGVNVPTLRFTGTVKLHGTNFGICRPINGKVSDIYFQSRERIITPLSDNAGSATWGYKHSNALNDLFDEIANIATNKDPENIIQIFGEWAGGNVQKGVGLSYIEKSFFVFGIRVSKDAASTKWLPRDTLERVIASHKINIDRLFSVYEFLTHEVLIDFNTPEDVQNLLGQLTMNVEKDCPVARRFMGTEFSEKLVGEGIVWTISDDQELPMDLSGVRFKVKGTEHSASKVRTLASVDVEKLKNVEEFVSYAVTSNRLSQGIAKLGEMGLEVSNKNTGVFIKWIMDDIIKEELDTLVSSNLTVRDVSGSIAKTAREFYLKSIS